MTIFSFGRGADAVRLTAALAKAQAIIEFKMDGTVLHANELFCQALGYELREIVGKHHSLFVDPAEVASPAYAEFWKKLAGGQFEQRQYKRIGKGGREIWIEASYNPVLRNGKAYKVVKIATDITQQKLSSAEDAGKMAALSRAQAIIEFTPDGQILTANDNFLNALGYTLAEIQGRQHSMFCEKSFTDTPAYAAFWQRLRAGEFIAEEFLRIGKGGREVHIQASYNPIFDMNGRVFKIVKFATDVSERVRNVNELATKMRALAEGDLTLNIARPFLPSLDQLRLDFNAAVATINATIQAVGDNAEQIAANAGQVSHAAVDLSRRTEAQAASVEETAAALEQITQTVQDSTRRADEAGKLVSEARENADHSGAIVRDAITAMGAIEQSSREITSIIGVIDEIAFQTNLLALNAGVEAARAGEAGKGFAVVAQEVRELAQRSATAAKEIKALITTSGAQVKSGVSLVGQTGEVLERISLQVRQVNDNVAAIVKGAHEQAIGLKEINIAVNTFDQGIQQNTAMVEETTAASNALASDAEMLFSLIRQFKTEGSQRRTPTAPVHMRPQPAASVPSAAPARKPVRQVGGTYMGNAAVAQEWKEF